MKRLIILFMLIFSLTACAVIAEGDALPSIDSLEIYQLRPGVVELSWWVSDDVYLDEYEIYKDDVLIKRTFIGGIKQSSRFRDVEAYGGEIYTFKVFDIAHQTVSENISLGISGEAIKDVKNESVELVVPENVSEPVSVPVVVVENLSAQEENFSVDVVEVGDESISEDSSFSITLTFLVMFLAVFLVWKFFPRAGDESLKTGVRKRYDDIGFDDYLHSRRRGK